MLQGKAPQEIPENLDGSCDCFTGCIVCRLSMKERGQISFLILKSLKRVTVGARGKACRREGQQMIEIEAFLSSLLSVNALNRDRTIIAYSSLLAISEC